MVCKFLALKRTHHIPNRLAVVANSFADLDSKLKAFAEGKNVAGAFPGQVKLSMLLANLY